MFCSHCGKELPDDAYVCMNCGCLVGDGKISATYTHAEKNGMAIAGFVCSFFSPLLGWIFGGIGLNRSAKRNGKGKGLSIAALVIATVSFAINIALL